LQKKQRRRSSLQAIIKRPSKKLAIRKISQQRALEIQDTLEYHENELRIARHNSKVFNNVKQQQQQEQEQQ
jgi:hypothetical protein